MWTTNRWLGDFYQTAEVWQICDKPHVKIGPQKQRGTTNGKERETTKGQFRSREKELNEEELSTISGGGRS